MEERGKDVRIQVYIAKICFFIDLSLGEPGLSVGTQALAQLSDGNLNSMCI